MTASNPSLLPANWLQLAPAELARLAPVQPLHWPALERHGVQLTVKREDLLDPHLGGNKVYKLHGHLRKACAAGARPVLASFGGAYSNHLYALAAAGRQLKLRTVGVVRGERAAILSPTLRDVEQMGMRLVFVSRERYRQRAEAGLVQALEQHWRSDWLADASLYWIPEGGGGRDGARACTALAEGAYRAAAGKVDVICHACGTGATVAGLAAGAHALNAGVWVQGVAVLKGHSGLRAEVDSLLGQLGCGAAPWQLVEGYHWGGYAKYPRELAEFVTEFESDHGLLLDPVYTSKLIWAIYAQARAGVWPAGTRVLAIHSGGLQGRRGFSQAS